ncbi:hypothetical protein RchiOBHm_Chr1g0328211 [Rosa chinensis]|uniref:Uncharacterized protein n=1 Tax=Rosa chinensis TaxID=74649 RepID=A0A2P6SAS3_ROSCH|nr:hypothetical protein RchiOBHm_Chr1g0328211 [Rosa chinensis]
MIIFKNAGPLIVGTFIVLVHFNSIFLFFFSPLQLKEHVELGMIFYHLLHTILTRGSNQSVFLM